MADAQGKLPKAHEIETTPFKNKYFQKIDARSGNTILDIGCGIGHDAGILAYQVGLKGTIYGVDIDRTVVEAASKIYNVPNIYFIHGDCQALPHHLYDKFDKCTADKVLQYIDDPDKALAEIFKILRPGGHIICHEPVWNTLAMRCNDPSTSDKIICSANQQGIKNKNIPLEMPKLLKLSGFSDIEIDVNAHVFTEFKKADTVFGFWRMAYGAAQKEVVTICEATKWLADQIIKDQDGEFLAYMMYLVYKAKKTINS
jgi:SAM-dependent methyltransferase